MTPSPAVTLRDAVALGDRQVGAGVDVGRLGVAVVGRVRIVGRRRGGGRVGQGRVVGRGRVDGRADDDLVAGAGDHRAQRERAGPGERAARAAARVEGVGLVGQGRRQDVVEDDVLGIRRSGVGDGDGVGQDVAGDDRVGAVDLDVGHVGVGLDDVAVGRRVVGRIGIGRGRADRGRVDLRADRGRGRHGVGHADGGVAAGGDGAEGAAEVGGSASVSQLPCDGRDRADREAGREGVGHAHAERVGRAAVGDRDEVAVRSTPSPAVTLVTPSLLVIDRSALVRTVLLSVAVLSLRVGIADRARDGGRVEPAGWPWSRLGTV